MTDTRPDGRCTDVSVKLGDHTALVLTDGVLSVHVDGRPPETMSMENYGALLVMLKQYDWELSQ